jgi:aspartyl-tRNA synthetase
MHPFRTYHCGLLTKNQSEKQIKISGWIHRKRNHGGLLFIDVRDHYGMIQCIVNKDNIYFSLLESTNLESVVIFIGKIVRRETKYINYDIITGEVELHIEKSIVESHADALPFSINSDYKLPEEIRLKYRFLDLRRNKIHNNICFRSSIISFIRKIMVKANFLEVQTPILTSSSPEGARDFVVPSRVYPGKFYALPQAPQQFKQLLMMSGYDKYFQIAPCFRDEDSRANRSPGEFYQLDIEMSFATQEDILKIVESITYQIFLKFSKKIITKPPFKRISFKESLLRYGTDKPDLRNSISMYEITDILKSAKLNFYEEIQKGSKLFAIKAPKASYKSRKFYLNVNNWIHKQGNSSFSHIILCHKTNKLKGPISKFIDDETGSELVKKTFTENGDALFIICDTISKVTNLAGRLREKIKEELDIKCKNIFHFVWIVDFPMFKYEYKTKKIDFFHNPFSMPQELLSDNKSINYLTVKAYQYDIVCNGIELSSGAIRNNSIEKMYTLFQISGYSKEEIDNKFTAIAKSFKFGAPPHGGCAPGIDRIVMLLLDEINLREVTAFPLNQQSKDLLMDSPKEISREQLDILQIDVKKSN